MDKDKVMKNILGDKYLEPEESFYNVFINYINYWIKYDSTKEEIDKNWLKTTNADTMFSLFIPLRTVVRHIHKKDKVITKSKLKKSFKKANDKISYLEKLLPKDNELVKKLQEFACLCSQIQNVISIPTTYINGKNINQYRGCCYYDQMPVMLYSILKGKITGIENRFSSYFENNKEVEEWIKSNRLDRLININDISDFKLEDLANLQENYGVKNIGLSITKKDYLFYNEYDDDRLKKVLDNYINILKN